MPTPDALPEAVHLVDFCPRTGQKRGDCVCATCLRAYGDIMDAIDRIPRQRQRTAGLTRFVRHLPDFPMTLAEVLERDAEVSK